MSDIVSRLQLCFRHRRKPRLDGLGVLKQGTRVKGRQDKSVTIDHFTGNNPYGGTTSGCEENYVPVK